MLFENPNATIAACGPECRAASRIATTPDWIWCSRRGEPRAIGDSAVECRSFTSRSSWQSGEPAQPGTPVSVGDAAGDVDSGQT